MSKDIAREIDGILKEYLHKKVYTPYAEALLSALAKDLATHLEAEVLRGRIDELGKLANDLSGNKVRISIVDLLDKIAALNQKLKGLE